MNIVSHEKTILDGGKELYRCTINNNGSLHYAHVYADWTAERNEIADIWRYLIKNAKTMIRLNNDSRKNERTVIEKA